jgi:hypothetical protein
LLLCLLLAGIAGLACGICAATSFAGVGKIRSMSGALALVLSACAVACWTLPQGRVLANSIIGVLESPALVAVALLVVGVRRRSADPDSPKPDESGSAG